MTTAAVIIPWRDRGNDPNRAANLDRVLAWWKDFGYDIHVVSDGRTGTAQFSRHAAYNRGAKLTTADILCFCEADTLVPYHQMDEAIQAARIPRLVVPFESQWHLSEPDTIQVRNGANPKQYTPVEKTPHRRNAGAVNVISRAALDLAGGWDEAFEGHHFDDDAMKILFERTTGNATHYIAGVSYHMHHLDASKGQHLTPADRAATQANRTRYHQYKKARTPEQIRTLTAGH